MNLSLVVCTYNRAEFIKSGLEHIAQQTLDKSLFEVLIINNYSTDNTEAVCQKFIEENPLLNIRLFFESQKGLSYARNRGIKEASTNIIVYIDDDALAEPFFLEEINKFFLNNPNAVGAGGMVEPYYIEVPKPKWMSKFLYGFVGDINFGNTIKKYSKSMKYPIGCNMTYKKDMLLKIGGFNNALSFRGDDKYIFNEIKKYSDEIYYLPNAKLKHVIDKKRLTFDSFKKLFLQSGNEAKERIGSRKISVKFIIKLIEYLGKAGVAILIWICYALIFEEIKGRYVFYSQYFTLKGFLSDNVFVR